MPNPQCQQRIRAEWKKAKPVISSKQLCAMGFPEEFESARMPVMDTCKGDSGGPAVKMVDSFKEKAILEGWSDEEREQKHVEMIMKDGSAPMRGQLVGITSWGFGCGQEIPSVYTRVTDYMHWITKYTDEISTPDDKVIYTTESATVEPTIAEPTTAEMTTAGPTSVTPTTVTASSAEPNNVKSTANVTTVETTMEPTTVELTTAELTAAEPNTVKPSTAEPNNVNFN